MIAIKANSAPTHAFSHGFTLIEVLIALFIGSVGLLALAAMQVSAIRGNGFANRITQATGLAQSKMEQLNGILLKVDNSINNALENVEDGFQEGVAQDGQPGGPFTLSWTVEPNTPFSRRITVNVSWRNSMTSLGLPHKVEFASVTRGIFDDGD